MGQPIFHVEGHPGISRACDLSEYYFEIRDRKDLGSAVLESPTLL